MARKSLKSKRAYIKGLITRAEKKIAALQLSGAFEKSFAVVLAQNTQSTAKNVNYGDKLFSIEGMRSSRELDREKGRLLAFLGDTTSNSEAAEVEYNAILANKKLEGTMFKGGRWVDTNRVDADIVKEAAKIYREIAEEKQHLLGKEAFDSNTFINMLYAQVDAAFKKHDNPFWSFENSEEHGDILAYGHHVLKMFEDDMIRGRFSDVQTEYGKLRKRRKR